MMENTLKSSEGERVVGDVWECEKIMEIWALDEQTNFSDFLGFVLFMEIV